MRVLVVTAVAAEAEAVCDGLVRTPSERSLPGGYTLTAHAGPRSGVDPGVDPGPRSYSGPRSGVDPGVDPGPHSHSGPHSGVDVLVAGVGPAAAACGTATALALSWNASSAYDLVVSAGIGGGFHPLAPIGSLVVADAIIAGDLGAETPDGFLPVDELGFGRSVHQPPQELAARISGLLDAVHAPVLTLSTVTGSAAGAAELTRRHPRAAAEAMEGFGVAEAAAAYSVPVMEIRAISNTVGPRDRSAWRLGPALGALRYAFEQLSPVFEESP